MDPQVVWSILGIAPEKDEEILKNRYHELLKSVNPEDDPEGFKRLREAYETALELAKTSENSESEAKPKDDIDLWLDRVNDVYWYASTRNNPELWKELFQDDICIALDTALEARIRLIHYLTRHCNLSREIWEIIDKEFHLIEDKNTLKEVFPREFLDYVQYQIENPNFFTYEDLEVLAIDESEVELDRYILAYMRCKSQIDQDMYKNMQTKLDDLKAYEVYHPYEDVERIRVYLHEMNPEAAVLLADKLLDKVPDNTYAVTWCGRAYWAMEQCEKAKDCWQHVLDIKPNNYSARVGLAEYYAKKEDYFEAKSIIDDLVEINRNDDQVLELMHTVNVSLIEYYKHAAAEGDYKKNMIEACWCMFQNELFQQAIDEVEQLNIQPEDEEYYDYVNMMGRCYIGMNNYEAAIEYLLKWEQAWNELIDDGSETYNKRITREGYIKSTIGVAYQQLGKNEEAVKYLSEGLEKESAADLRHDAMDRLSFLCYDMQDYDKCIEVCTKLIDEDSEYYPAYVRRQEAAFAKRDAQQVVDDFYNAIYIFPKYYKPYLLAVQVFFIYRQYEDAEKVLKLAKEQEIHQELLSLYEIRVMRHLVNTDEEYQNLFELCNKLQEKLKKNAGKKDILNECLAEEIHDNTQNDVAKPEDVEYEKILIYMDRCEFDTALELLAQEMQKGDSSHRLQWARADLYRQTHSYEEALKDYEALKRDIPDNTDIDYGIAICLRGLGKIEEAIEKFQQVLEQAPQHPSAHHELMKIYSRRFNTYELKSAYGSALKEINAQLEIVPSAYYYIERGLLYMDNFNFDQALADYQKALELEPENVYAYNNIATVLEAKGQFEEALTYYSKALEIMKDDRTILPYKNSADCYEAMCQWDRAIDMLNEALKYFKPTDSIYNQLADLYTDKMDVDMVIKVCTQARELKLMSRETYYVKVHGAYFAAGRLAEGRAVLKEWERQCKMNPIHGKDKEEKFQILESWGAYYFYHKEYAKAKQYLEEAWTLAKKHGFYRTKVGIHLAETYYWCKQWSKAREVAQDTLNYMITGNHIPEALKNAEPENPESLQYYLSYRPLAPLRLFETAQLYIAMGDLDMAEQLLNQGCQAPRCYQCAHAVCCDVMMIRAHLEEARGNIDEAIRLLEQAQQINPSDREPALALDALRNGKDGHK